MKEMQSLLKNVYSIESNLKVNIAKCSCFEFLNRHFHVGETRVYGNLMFLGMGYFGS